MASTNVPFTQYLLELLSPVLGPAVAARQLYNAASDVFNQQVQAPVYDYNLAVPQNPTPEMMDLYRQVNGVPPIQDAPDFLGGEYDYFNHPAYPAYGRRALIQSIPSHVPAIQDAPDML